MIPIKLPITFFTELEQITKIYTEPYKAQKCESNPRGRKKNKARSIILPDFRQYYNATTMLLA